MHDKNSFPREDTISYHLLELTAICGEFPVPLLIRLPCSTSYKESVITFLKKEGLLRTYYRDKLRGYRLGRRAKSFLLAENPDTVAWIRLEEPAVISYPVVKSRDNEEYLTKTFSANDNKLGAIFLDMRCHSSFTDRNSIIYGHNLKVGGEMFSQLNAYADEEFCKQHPYFYIYTPDGMTKVYQVFSAGVVKATADNYDVEFATDEDFQNYLELCRNSSNYQVEVELNSGSRIVTLSTCTNVLEDERFVVQGVLIEER